MEYGNYHQPPPPHHPPHQQQQQQSSTVIVHQPTGGVGGGAIGFGGQNKEEWTTGICGCFEDCCSCLYAHFCHICFMCTLANEMRECSAGPFCCGTLFVVAMRTKLRSVYGIRGSIYKDICATSFCHFCVALQMHRELKNRGAIL